MATIREVAKEAGVSLGTVSRYLNGHQLKKTNMDNIRAAIEKLGYEENIIAKGLKNNKSLSIGVVINTLTDVFATSIVTYLESYLEENNYSLILCDYQNDLQKLEKKLEFLRSRSVDGVVIFHLEEKLAVLDKFRNEGIPIIAVDAPIADFQTDTVLVDNYHASYTVVEKLAKLGHKKIGVIAGSQDRFIGRERLNGYVDAMKNLDLYDSSLVKIGDYKKESGYVKAGELLAEGEITALYSTNYYMTLGAVQAIYEQQLVIPEDVSVIGFDHFELSDILQPKLTVIEQPVQQIGETIGTLLIKKIKDSDSAENAVVELPTTLLWRDSTKKIQKGLEN
ncbi:LacI family DNA-binding transcriptional regulator [Enterococcus wangshanyuanii]|uniref:LacI family transcriptional regulator n=1 Tax=Enterococcus wangshanyuanii TaxID=2005703 RepID=A0ABQ1NW32_9ENTE|nr:LacI family DNA-binding transcriptional regulator [Enterococcus wangshanyuanii]GGC86224.1 LacI family transcriptional regulator [Enterococcus wangshanyuanii]